jgi:ribosomal-protein-alanine N-acetyltransferase
MATKPQSETKPTIVTMRYGDLEEVCRIERESFTSPWPWDAFTRSLEDPGSVGLVARDDTGVVGYVICWFFMDYMLVANLAVRPDRRSSGWGSRLLEAALQAARQEGVREVLLDVRVSNLKAIRLYERFGFRVVGRRRHYYTRPVEDALVMMRQLS